MTITTMWQAMMLVETVDSIERAVAVRGALRDEFCPLTDSEVKSALQALAARGW